MVKKWYEMVFESLAQRSCQKWPINGDIMGLKERFQTTWMCHGKVTWDEWIMVVVVTLRPWDFVCNWYINIYEWGDEYPLIWVYIQSEF